MTHITIQVPARVVIAPRGAEPLANAALALFSLGSRAGNALLSGLRSRHLLAHAPRHDVACKDGIGSIKG